MGNSGAEYMVGIRKNKDTATAIQTSTPAEICARAMLSIILIASEFLTLPDGEASGKSTGLLSAYSQLSWGRGEAAGYAAQSDRRWPPPNRRSIWAQRRRKECR